MSTTKRITRRNQSLLVNTEITKGTPTVTKTTRNKTQKPEIQINKGEDINENRINNDEMESEKTINGEVGNIQIQFSNLEGENRCQHCKEVFQNPILLLRHKRKEHSFPKRHLLLEDIEKYYDYPNRSFCPICKRTLKSNNFRCNFIKHLQTHAKVNTIECVICKQKFKRKEHMLNHQKRHIVPIEDFIKNKKAKR